MANKLNFTGWSGKTDFLSGSTFNLSNLNIEGRTQNSPQANSKFTAGPVVINKNRPKKSTLTPGVKQPPVAQVEPEQIFDFSKASKLGRPSELSSTLGLESTGLPFTAGTIDTSFPNGVNTGFSGGTVSVSKIQSDGKIIVGGSFSSYTYNGNTYYAPYLIRLNSDGSPDFDFYYTLHADADGWSINGTVYTIDIQSDGKILIGGDFTAYSGGTYHSSVRIMRFDSNGTVDTTLLVGDGFNSTVLKIIVQPDGNILVAGGFNTYNSSPYDPASGTTYWRIIRLQSNGNPDLSFNPGYGFDWDDGGTVYDMILQPNGKIICGGTFYNYNNVDAYNIVRLNSDGSRDNTFVTGAGFNDDVYTIALQSDGKIIVGGYFDNFNNNDLFGGHIIRLTTNGSIDTLFGYGTDGPVYSLVIQSDDKILVGGNITDFYPNNNTTININEIVRFHSDCTLDYGFAFDEILNGQVNSITLDSDNKIYIGGDFYEDGSPFLLNRFGRINNFISEYPYTYAVHACAQPLIDETIIYMVGSMIELNPFVTYSFQSLQNPSITVCGYLVDIFPSNLVEYSVVNEYVDCEEAYTSNYKFVVFEECLGYFQQIPLWVVDNRFEIGDIFYVDTLVQEMGVFYLKFAATIIDVIPWSGGTGPFGPVWYYLPPTNYVTYSSCDEAIEANGVIYEVDSCTTPETFYALIHTPYYDYTTILVPTEDNPVKYINGYLPIGPYEFISGGTPEIFSAIKIADGIECELGLSKIAPEGILNQNFGNTGFAGSFVNVTVEQPDGKILVGGDFTDYLEVGVGNFMRINTDGSLDETFNNTYCNSPVWSTSTPFSNTSSGSIYFDGTPLCELNADTDTGVWDLGNNNITFEWFQYFTGDVTHLSPTVFDYSNNDLRVFFQNGDISVVIDGDTYSYELNSTISDVWCHIAVTRYYDPKEDVYIWRVFQNGIQLGQFNYSFSFNQDPLIIGNSNNPDNNRGFKGYITNFRVNNGNAIYTENFAVPTEPLNPNYTPGNTVLCLSVNNETDYILDNCDDEISTSVNSPDYYRLPGFNSGVRTIALQPDGKILVGGNFTDYNGEYAGRIIRLNSDGTIDQDFTYSTEFNGTVNTIALQKDGKILVGGQFNYYYDFHCEQIVRLNSDGSPDFTFDMGDGFDGDRVYIIVIESILNPPPFYVTNGPITNTYTENIIVGGQFNYYKGTNNLGGIVKLSPTGDVLPDFGNGFNRAVGNTPRVNNIVKQPDGKLIVVGGGYGNDLKDYNETFIPKNIVRLVKDGNEIYQIDQTFTTHDWDGDNYSGGFGGAAFALTLLPNNKIMVGGFFSYYGDNITGYSTSHLVRLNSDGTLDTTFTFQISAVVYTTDLLSSKILLVGGRFSSPMDRMLELFIGEEYELRSFTTCDGKNSNIFLPKTTNSGFAATPISYELISTDGLDLVYNGDNDDDNFVITLPTPFDVNFLGVNYTSINVSTNPYITFGSGGTPSACCFDIPNEIPSEVGLPGVFVSFQCGTPHSPGDYDADMLQLYTGLTDGGNTLIIKYFGKDHCNNDEVIPLNYTYRFYKDNSDYFDLLIDDNTLFFNGDPTGGISNGVNPTWVTTFNSAGGNAYRIGNVVNTIKANVNERVAVCGTVGNVITTPNLNPNSGIGGSMYFDGATSLVTIAHNNQMDLDFGPWTVEWYQKYTSTDTCCRRVFDIGQNPGEEFGVSIENGNTLILWIASGSTTINLATPVYNVWSYFAITSENLGGATQTIRVYQDGVLIYSGSTTFDINNFQGDPSVDLPLVIGGGDSGTNSLFEGYITNFRWTKGDCYYVGLTMNVPIYPLDSRNSQLLFLTTNETGLLTNACDGNPNAIPSNEISATNLTWSSESPFVNLYDFSLFTATDLTSYNSCTDCGQMFKTILYVRDGANPNYVLHTNMSPTSINNVLTNGPIFTTRGPQCYEILKYTY